MHIHGLDDYIIAYGNRWDWKEWDSVGTMFDIPGLISFWQQQFSCQSSTENTSQASSHTVHAQCAADVRVEHHGLYDVGHEWPERINGTPTYQVIWTFLSEFAKP